MDERTLHFTVKLAIYTMASAAWNHPGRNPPTNTDPFAHVRYLPMFGLLADEDFAIVAKTHEHAAKMAGYVQPVPELNIAEKVVLHASGIDIINPRKIDNALIKTNVAAITLTATAVHVAILTRWSAISDDGRTVVVDVYETRAIMGTQLGNPWSEYPTLSPCSTLPGHGCWVS